jgi:hypothetical protein
MGVREIVSCGGDRRPAERGNIALVHRSDILIKVGEESGCRI